MDLKFVSTLKSFFPQGKIWDFQTNFNYLIDGISDEFGRSHKTATQFYNDFNIIKSESLASLHGVDYLIISGLYTNREIQRIIIEYLNKDYDFRDVIEDFANFIGVDILWSLPEALEFGVFQFGDEFGSTESQIGSLYLTIGIEGEVTCQNWNKINWLVQYLKPPYINVEVTDAPITSIIPFTFGLSQFGDDFGELNQCQILN